MNKIYLTLRSMKPGLERGMYIGPIVLGGVKFDKAFLVEEKGDEIEYKRISGLSDQGSLTLVEIRTQACQEDAATKINRMILLAEENSEFSSWTISFSIWMEDLLDPDIMSSLMLLDDSSKIDFLSSFFRDLSPVKNLRSFFDEEEGPSSDILFISFRLNDVEFFVFSRPLLIEGEHRMEKLNRNEAIKAFDVFSSVIKRLSSF
jgi:hypothetical protein